MAELFPSEKAWLPAVFEPIRLARFPELSFYLCDEPTSDKAHVVYLQAVDPRAKGLLALEVFVYRARHVQVYGLVDHWLGSGLGNPEPTPTPNPNPNPNQVCRARWTPSWQSPRSTACL